MGIGFLEWGKECSVEDRVDLPLIRELEAIRSGADEVGDGEGS